MIQRRRIVVSTGKQASRTTIRRTIAKDSLPASDKKNKNIRSDVTENDEVSIINDWVWIVCATVFCGFGFICLEAMSELYQWYGIQYLKQTRWTSSRYERESTFPPLLCHATDFVPIYNSSNSMHGIIIHKDNVSRERPEEIVLQHGVGFFPQILSPSTVQDLRDYILWKIEHSSRQEQIDVIENENRWSSSLDWLRDDRVLRAFQEIMKNDSIFHTILTRLLGDDPALVESSFIAVRANARGQYFHTDTRPMESHVRMGASVVPLYSLLIPLQDTSLSMGPTQVCPGTQYCTFCPSCAISANTNNSNHCQRPLFGDIASNRRGKNTSAFWKAGDGLLFNSLILHRGSAHTDQNGPHRVVLIVSFASRPDHHKTDSTTRSRQKATQTNGNGMSSWLQKNYYTGRSLPVGSVWAIPWYRWGYTWSSFQQREQTLGGTAQSLPSQATSKKTIAGNDITDENHDGWTFLSTLGFRMTNEALGYRHEDLMTYVQTSSTIMAIYYQVLRLVGHLPAEDDPHPFATYFATLLHYAKWMVYVLHFLLIWILYSISLPQTTSNTTASVNSRATRGGTRYWTMAALYFYGILTLGAGTWVIYHDLFPTDSANGVGYGTSKPSNNSTTKTDDHPFEPSILEYPDDAQNTCKSAFSCRNLMIPHWNDALVGTRLGTPAALQLLAPAQRRYLEFYPANQRWKEAAYEFGFAFVTMMRHGSVGLVHALVEKVIAMTQERNGGGGFLMETLYGDWIEMKPHQVKQHTLRLLMSFLVESPTLFFKCQRLKLCAYDQHGRWEKWFGLESLVLDMGPKEKLMKRHGIFALPKIIKTNNLNTRNEHVLVVGEEVEVLISGQSRRYWERARVEQILHPSNHDKRTKLQVTTMLLGETKMWVDRRHVRVPPKRKQFQSATNIAISSVRRHVQSVVK